MMDQILRISVSVLSCMERDDTLEILLSDGCIRLVILECVDM